MFDILILSQHHSYHMIKKKCNLSFDIYCIIISIIVPEKTEIVQIRRRLLLSTLKNRFSAILFLEH